MADGMSDISVVLRLIMADFEAGMKRARDVTRTAMTDVGASLQGLGSSGYWQKIDKEMGEFIVSSRAWSGASKEMQAQTRGVAQTLGKDLPDALGKVPAAAKTAEHGTRSLMEHFREFRTEVRQGDRDAAFLGKILGEVGIAGGTAGRAIADVGLNLAELGTAALGGPLAIVAGIELAIAAVGQLVEHFKGVHEAQEKAKEHAREFGLEMKLVAMEAAEDWERFRAGLENAGLPEAIRRAKERMQELQGETKKAQATLESLKGPMEELAKKQGVLVAGMPISPMAQKTLADPITAGMVKRFPDMKAFADHLAAEGESAGKETYEKFIKAFEDNAKAEKRLAEVPKGTAESLEKETAENRLGVDRQVHAERTRFVGEELRLETEKSDKLAELAREREKLEAQRPPVAATGPDADRTRRAIDAQLGEIDRKRQATEDAGNLAVEQARKKHEDELRAISVKAAEVTATDREKILLAGEEAVAKLRAARAVAAKVDPAEAARLGREIAQQEAVTAAQLRRFDLERQITQQAQTREALFRLEGLTADSVAQVQIRGASELARLEDERTKAKERQGAGRDQEIAHVEKLIALQQQLNAEQLAIAKLEQEQSRGREVRALEARVREARGEGGSFGKGEEKGSAEVANARDALTVAQKKEEIAERNLALTREQAGATELQKAQAQDVVDAAKAEVTQKQRLLGLTQEVTAAEAAKRRAELAETVAGMKEAGFDADKQRAIAGVRSTEKQEMDLAKSAKAAGLISPAEFDKWSADIQRKSREAALLAREPWVKDFAGGVSRAFMDVATRAKSLKDAVSSLGEDLRRMVADWGAKKIEKSLEGTAASLLGGGKKEGAGEAAAAQTTATATNTTALGTATTTLGTTTTALGTMSTSLGTLQSSLVTLQSSLVTLDASVAGLTAAVNANSSAKGAGGSGLSLPGLGGGGGGNGEGGGAGSEVTALAEGGEFGAHRPLLVGERGPELMVPGFSGSVIPNNALQRAAGAYAMPSLSGSRVGRAELPEASSGQARAQRGADVGPQRHVHEVNLGEWGHRTLNEWFEDRLAREAANR